LYYTARWRAWRAQVLSRNPFCVDCQRLGRTTIATEIDHVVPHRGDLARFWDPTNVQGLCATCHGQKTQAGR